MFVMQQQEIHMECLDFWEQNQALFSCSLRLFQASFLGSTLSPGYSCGIHSGVTGPFNSPCLLRAVSMRAPEERWPSGIPQATCQHQETSVMVNTAKANSTRSKPRSNFSSLQQLHEAMALVILESWGLWRQTQPGCWKGPW